MNERSELARVLTIWLEDGPSTMPDRVIDVVADRVGRQRQRRGWPYRGRTNVTTPLKLIAALAAAIVVAVVGYNLLPRQPAVGTASPTPAPTVSASPALTTAPSRALRGGDLEPGTYTGELFQGTTKWTMTVPVGWRALGTNAIVPATDPGPSGPTGVGIVFSDATNVPGDPCDAVGAASDATSVADVVAALRSREDLAVTNATETALGGFSGTRIDVEVPADLSACDGTWLIFAEPDGDGFYAQGPSNLLRYWILDVDGHIVTVLLQRFAETPAADVTAAQGIIDSIQITP